MLIQVAIQNASNCRRVKSLSIAKKSALDSLTCQVLRSSIRWYSYWTSGLEFIHHIANTPLGRTIMLMVKWTTDIPVGRQLEGCLLYSVLGCSSGTIATCSVFLKKTGDHLLGSASCLSNFCWIWFILKQPYNRLLFTFGLICVNPRFIICHDVIDVFRSTAIIFLEHFFRPVDTSLFLSNWQIVWDPMRTNFFLQSNVHAILNV